MICEIIDWLHDNAGSFCGNTIIDNSGKQNRDRFDAFVQNCINDANCAADGMTYKNYSYKTNTFGDNSTKRIRPYLWGQFKNEQHSTSRISLSVFISGNRSEPALRICTEYRTHKMAEDPNHEQIVDAYNKIFDGPGSLPEGLYFYGPFDSRNVNASIRNERNYSDIKNLLAAETNFPYERYQVAFLAQKDGFPNPKNLPTFKNDEEFRQLCIKGINAILPFYQKIWNDNQPLDILPINGENPMTMLKKEYDISQIKKNVILQGAPGTGKTYSTAAMAMAIVEKGNIEQDMFKPENRKDLLNAFDVLRIRIDKATGEICNDGQIGFVTFHQSMDYEDFVEGIKPIVEGEGAERKTFYDVRPGIFKAMCAKAKQTPDKNFVLVIDEINRGNVSKIFGELITLLEADKRFDASPDSNLNTIEVILPYSKEQFVVPSNLYIIGTMNTTDRSVGAIDYAVRRRFSFITLRSNQEIINSYDGFDGDTKNKALRLFDDILSYLRESQIKGIDFEDLMVGHSYFLAKNKEELELKWEFDILPLLQEYHKDGLLNKSPKEYKDSKGDAEIFCGFSLS